LGKEKSKSNDRRKAFALFVNFIKLKVRVNKKFAPRVKDNLIFAFNFFSRKLDSE